MQRVSFVSLMHARASAEAHVDTEEPDALVAAPLGLLALPRDLFRGGLAGLVCGVAFFGVLGRLVMRASALLNPDRRGATTENGNVIGEITLDGTLELIFFAGVFGGLLAGYIWVLVRDWLPTSGPRRTIAAGLTAACLGSFGVLSETNFDFRILSPGWLHVAMFLALIGLAGSAIAMADELIDRVLPAGRVAAVLYAVLALPVGLMGTAVLLQALLAQRNLLALVAGALAVVAAASLLDWRTRYLGGARPRWLGGVAIGGLVGASAFALVHFWTEIGEVL